MLAAGKPHALQRQSQRPPQRPLTDTLTRRYKDEKGHEREEAVALEGYSRREVREENDHFFNSMAPRESDSGKTAKTQPRDTESRPATNGPPMHSSSYRRWQRDRKAKAKNLQKETQGATGSAVAAEKLDRDPREHNVVYDNETAQDIRSDETETAGVKTSGAKNDHAHDDTPTVETKRDAAAEQLASNLQEKDKEHDHDVPTTERQNTLLEEEATYRRDDEEKLKRQEEERKKASQHQEGKSANREDHCPSANERDTYKGRAEAAHAREGQAGWQREADHK